MSVSAKSTAPLAIEPFDKEWGVGVSGMTEDPSPFPRVNNILRWFKDRPTTADPQRMLIFTEAYKKYAADPQIVKVAKALRDVLCQVDVNIWPGELIVGDEHIIINEGKIIADELITREVTLDTLVEDGFEYLIKHGPEQIKVLIKISE